MTIFLLITDSNKGFIFLFIILLHLINEYKQYPQDHLNELLNVKLKKPHVQLLAF